MFETKRESRQGSWPTAMGQYRRLCADPASGAINTRSAAGILREALPRTSWRGMILQALHEAEEPLTAEAIAEALTARVSGVRSYLIGLMDDGVIERQRHSVPGGGREFTYRLSPLGRLVMDAKELS